MTEQEQTKVALDEAKDAFAQARAKRQTARQTLRNSEKKLNSVRHSLKALRKQKRLLENTRDKTIRVLEQLAARIDKAEAGLARARARQKSADTAGQHLQEMQAKRRQLQDKQAKNDEDLGQISDQIQTKEDEEKKAHQAATGDRKNLVEQNNIVTATAAEYNKETAVAPKEEIGLVLSQLYGKLHFSGTVSLGYAYSVLLGLVFDYVFYRRNDVHIFHYSQPEDFFISGYKLLIIPFLLLIVLYGLQLLISLCLRKVVGLKISFYAEKVAFVLPGLVNRLPVKKFFFCVFLFASIAGTIAAGFCWDNHQQSNEDKVSIATVSPSQKIDNIKWVGSNSTYAFFKQDAKDNGGTETNLIAIPLNRIVCINEHPNSTPDHCAPPVGDSWNQSEASAATRITVNMGNNRQVDRLISAIEGLSHQHLVIEQLKPHSLKLEDSPQMEKLISVVDNKSPSEVKLRHEIIVKPDHNPGGSQLIMNWPGLDLGDLVTESQLRAFIPEKIICNDSRFAMSEFIYFDHAKDVLDGNEAKKIQDFMTSLEQIKELWLFSFTSPDGEGGHNNRLAKQRACAVRGEILKNFDGEINIQPIAEDHPINGIANSRSAVIAACGGNRVKPESAANQTPPLAPCPGPG